MTYPQTPGFKERGATSQEAAQSVASSAKTLRDAVLREIRWKPGTADEIAERLSVDILSVRPRLSELRNKKMIEPTGERRDNRSGKAAQVWRTPTW